MLCDKISIFLKFFPEHLYFAVSCSFSLFERENRTKREATSVLPLDHALLQCYALGIPPPPRHVFLRLRTKATAEQTAVGQRVQMGYLKYPSAQNSLRRRQEMRPVGTQPRRRTNVFVRAGSCRRVYHQGSTSEINRQDGFCFSFVLSLSKRERT